MGQVGDPHQGDDDDDDLGPPPSPPRGGIALRGVVPTVPYTVSPGTAASVGGEIQEVHTTVHIQIALGVTKTWRETGCCGSNDSGW